MSYRTSLKSITLAILIVCAMALGGVVQASPTLSDYSSEAEAVSLDYAASTTAGELDAAYHIGAEFAASNPSQGYDLTFGAEGVTLEANGQALTYALSGFGYGDSLTYSAAERTLAGVNRVEYARGAALTEWYVNGPQGVQQGYTFAERPAVSANGWLTVAVAVSGDYTPTLRGNIVELVGKDGSVLTYGGLLAYDAVGKFLPVKLEVSGDLILLRANDVAAVYPVTIDPIVQQQKLNPGITSPNGNAGDSVAIDGDYAVVGAPGVNGNEGRTFIYQRSGATWTLVQTLSLSGAGASPRFGSAVALALPYLVVGAPVADSADGAGTGDVLVYQLTGGNFVVLQSLTADTTMPLAVADTFGNSVAISADGSLIFAASREDEVDIDGLAGDEINAGSALIFEFNAGTGLYTFGAKTDATAYNGLVGRAWTAGEIWFGYAVDVNNAGQVIIGAPNYDSVNGLTNEAGLVFTAQYNTALNTFSVASAVQSDSVTASSGFGLDVDLSTAHAIAGQPNGNNRALIYDMSGTGVLTFDSTFTNVLGTRMGFAVEIDDARALVGVPGSGGVGAVFHYVPSGATWIAAPVAQTTNFSSPSAVAGDDFGSSVAIDGGFIVVGSLGDDTGSVNAGSAYVFSVPDITVSDVTVIEGNSIVFTFTRSDGGGSPIVINYTFNGVTTEVTDRGTATPASGFVCTTATCTVTITTVDDAIYDDPAPAETLTLSGITATAGGVAVNVNGVTTAVTVTGTITDNEGVPTLSIISPDGQDESVTPQNFLIQLSHAREVGTVTFNCRTQAASASNIDGDYTAFGPGACSVSIPAGTTSINLPVALLNDAVNEPDEFYTVAISTPTNATLGSTLGIGYIYDDDPIPDVSISCPATVQEGDAGTQALACTLTLSGANSYASSVRVSVNPVGGEADATDIVQVTNQLVNIPAGTTSVQFLAQVYGDVVVEDDEDFTVTLSSPVGITLGTALANVSIINDDTAVASIVVDNATITEAGPQTATYTITLSKPTEAGIVVSLTTSGTAVSGLDTTAVTPISVACLPLATTCTLVTQTAVNDAIFEGPETLSLTIAAGAGYTVGSPATATTIIVDDDLAPGISLDSCTIGDEFGPVNIVCTVSIPVISALNASASFVVIPGTATTPEDYSTSSGTVTILAGNSTGTFSITVVNDTWFEGGSAALTLENVTVILTNPVNAVASNDMSEQAFIRDDDAEPIFQLILGETLLGLDTNGDPNSEPEDVSQSLCFDMVSGATAIPLDFNFFFTNGTAIAGEDFQYVQDPFTIPAGTVFSGSPCEYVIFVPVIDDPLWEGGVGTTEDLVVEVVPVDNGIFPPLSNIGFPLTVEIEDNELVVPQIRILDAQVIEGNAGTTQLVFVAQLVDVGGAPVTAGVPVTFSYVSTAGTATTIVDYTDVSGTATILKGQTSTTIIVNVVGDLINEPNETLTLTGSAAAPTGVTFFDATAIGTIINDDVAPALTVSVAPASAVETDANNIRTVTVSVPNDSTSQTINFNYTFVGSGTFPAVVGLVGGCPVGTTDVIQNTASGTITPVIGTPASFSTTFTVTVCGDDRIDADTETAGVRLSNATNVNPNTSVFAADFDIIDDDSALVQLSGPVTVAENAGTATYTITLTDSVSAPMIAGTDVTVTYSVTAGTATAGVDYIAGATGSVTIPAGSSSATITVLIVNDLLDENTENYTVAVVNATGVGTTAGDFGAGVPFTITTDITDDDASPIISINDVMVTEGTGGTTTALFTISQTTISSLATSVTVTSAGGTATDGTDYTTVAAVVATIPAGQLSVTFPVNITTDSIDEANETYTLTLTAPVNATLGDAVGAGVIIDDDESPSLSVADESVVETNAGSVNVTFDFTLSALSNQTIPFSYYFVQNGTATAGVDYAPGACVIATPCTSVFPANSLTHTVTVNALVTGDTLFEANETFGIVVVPTNASQVSPFGSDLNGVITIVNDDTAAGLVIDVNDLTLTEGASGTTLVTLSAAQGQDITVTYSFNDATAVTPGDYQDQNLVSVVIPAGSTTAPINVATNQDTLFELAETFNIELVSAIAADTTVLTGSIFGTPGVVTINDDGDAQPIVNIADIALAEGNAGNTGFNFPISLNTASGVPVFVNWTGVLGTTEVNDFGFTPGCAVGSGTVTIPAGQISAVLPVCILGDTVYEDDETFFINYTVTNGTPTVGDTTGVGTVINDDAAPTITINSVTVTEGNLATLTITRTGATEVDVTGTFATADVTATAGVDYSTTSGSFTIVNSLALTATTTVTVTTLQDLIDEPAETLNVVLSNLTGSSTVSAIGVVTIDDDDAAPTIAISDVTAVEGQNLIFTLTLSNPSASTVTVTYNLNDGTAVATDYVDATGTVTFLPGEVSKTLTVETVQDNIFEAAETLTVDLSAPVNAGFGDNQGVGTITDNDAAPRVISAVDFTISESGGTATVDVTLSNPSFETITLNAALSDALATITGGATCTGFPVDYDNTLTPVQVIFAPFVTTASLSFDICADVIDEANEDVLFSITAAPVTGTITAAGSDLITVVTIVDDDATPTVQLVGLSQLENVSPFAFQVVLVDPTTDLPVAFTGQQVTFGYTITPGTATAGLDYTGTSGTFVIPAGTDLSVLQFITVPVINDALFEADETFTVTLTSAINATLTDSVGVNVADPIGEGVILNDDFEPIVTITYVGPNGFGAPTVEGDLNGMVYEIELSAAAGVDIEVGYYTGNVGDTATEGLDYGSIEDRIVIPAGSTLYTVYISVVDDALYEGGVGTTETVTVLIYPTDNSPFVFFNDTDIGEIEDNDTAPTLSINDVQVIETVGGVNAVFVVTQSTYSGLNSTFTINTTAGTATSAVDYTAIAAGTGTIPAGQLSTTVTVAVLDDLIYEATEQYTVDLTLPVNSNLSAITDASGLGTIVDNEPAPTISIGDVTILEGGAAVLTITRTGQSAVAVTGTYSTVDVSAVGGLDYTSETSNFTIPASLNAVETVTVPAVIDIQTTVDAIDELTETLNVVLTNVLNATVIDDTGVVTITDNSATPDISIADSSAVEGQLMSFTLTLSNPSSQTVTVVYNLNDGTAVGADYLDTTGTVTFAPGQTTATLTVQTINDVIFEAVETFTVDLSGSVNANILDAQAIGTITDNDAAPVVTSAADFNVNEGNAGTATVTITVTLSNPSYEVIQLNTGLALLSPTLGGGVTCTGFPVDVVFFATPLTLTFAPGATTATATIDVCGDIIDEDNETVQFSLVPSVGAITVAGSDFTTDVTIIDDDTLPLAVINDVTQVEEVSPFVFTVTLLDPVTNAPLTFAGRDITIGYTITEGSALEPQDYIGTGGTIVIPEGTNLTTPITINVPVINDAFFEADETFTITLNNVTNATLIDSFLANVGDPVGVGTILNTDTAPGVTVTYIGPDGFGAPTLESDTTGMAYQITLNVAAGLPIEIGYSTGAVTDTAIAGLDYTDLADRVVFLPGTTSITVFVPVINDTLYEGPVNETVTMTISTTPNTPLGVTTGAPAVGSILDDDAMPSLVINDVQIIEGDAGSINAILTVTQSAYSGLPSNFVINTADGTAVQPGDYTAIVAGAGVVPAGFLTTTVSVPVIGDTIFEADETFDVVLSAPVNATIADASGVVTIIDNEAEPRITITAAPDPVAEAGGTQQVVYTITLSNLSAFPVTFNWATADGTASSTHDYTAEVGAVVIPPNTLTVAAAFDVQVIDDALFDLPTETYLVNLTNIVGADIPNSETFESVDITDNEAAPFVNLVIGTVVSATEGANLVFTAQLSTDAAGTIPTAVGTNVTFVMNSSDGLTIPVARLSQPDYKDADGTLYTFLGNGAVSSLPVIIETINDLLPENTENVTASLSLPTGSLISLGSNAVREGQILDTPDAQPTVSIADATVTEGGTLDFVVALSFVSGQDISVTVALADVTTSPADYTVPGVLTVTIPAGSASVLFSVPTVADLFYEVDETLTATLSVPVNATILDGVATGTIINDDVPPTITIDSVSVVEGNAGLTAAVLTVTLSQPAGVPVSVGFDTANGTATLADNDYQAVVDQTLTIAPGLTTGTITTQVVGDLNFETDETYSVVLSTPENGTLGAPSVGVVTILNDDVQPTVTIAGPAAPTNEGTTDDTYRTFTFTLSAESFLPVTVNYNTVDGMVVDFQALAGDNDYVAQTSTVVFAPGQTVATIQVRVLADNKYENDEDYSVLISGATNATVGLADEAFDTIVNDDAIPTVTLMADLSVIENVTPVYVTATLSNPSGFPTIIDLTYTDGPAVPPSLFAANNPADYAPVDVTLTFPAGVSSIVVANNGLTGATVVSGTPAQVTIVNDLIDEYDERFTVTGTVNVGSGPVVLGADVNSIITIIDNDRTPKLLVSDISVPEAAGVGTVTFSLVNPDTNLAVPTGRDVVIMFSLADGTAVVVNDYLNEVDIANPLLANQTCTSATLCTAIITGDGVATSVAIDITIVDDLVYENPDQFFYVNVEDATNVDTLTSDQQGIVTIISDDLAPTLTITPLVSVNEGNVGVTPMNFVITVSAPLPEAEISFLFNTLDGNLTTPALPQARVNDADYVEIQPMMVSIPPLTASTTVTVQVLGDTTYELTEYLTAQISGAVNATIGVGVGNAYGIGEIVNDDALPVINIIDSQVFEGDAGTTQIVFDVALETISGFDVTFTVTTSDGTATLTDVVDGLLTPDYVQATAAGPFTIAEGEQSTQITLLVNGDLKFEADEVFNVTITPDANATPGDVVAQGTIINDDEPPVISINDVSVVETNAGTVNVSFILTLSNAAQFAYPMPYKTFDGVTPPAATLADLDYNAQNSIYTLPQDVTSATFTIVGLVNGDTKFELNDQFTFELLDVFGPGQPQFSKNVSVVTITNDDIPPVVTVNSALVVTTPEGNGPAFNQLVFTAVLSNATYQTLVVPFDTSDGTATMADLDYQQIIDGGITFAENALTKTFAVNVVGDNKYELAETVNVTLDAAGTGTAGTYTVGAPATHFGTITNDDAAPTITLPALTAAEGTPMNITAVLSNPSYEAITVTLNTAAGGANPATAGADYAAAAGVTLTFPASVGITNNLVSSAHNAAPVADGLYELPEHFLGTITAGTGATTSVQATPATFTITSNDPIPTLEITNVSALEGDTGTTPFTFTVTQSVISGETTSFQVFTADGTAKATAADYSSITGTTFTIPEGATTVNVTVTVNGDVKIEADETFFVNLSNLSNAVALTDGIGDGVILNDDAAIPIIPAGSEFGFEGGLGTWRKFTPTNTNYDDKRRCVGGSVEGNCYFRFKGKPDEDSRLIMDIPASQIPVGLGTGLNSLDDALRIAMYYRTGAAQPRVSVKIRVSFNDGTPDLFFGLLGQTPGQTFGPTGGYDPEDWVEMSDDSLANYDTSDAQLEGLPSNAIRRIRILIRHETNGAKIDIDDIRLDILPSEALPRGAGGFENNTRSGAALELPAAPDGFRDGN